MFAELFAGRGDGLIRLVKGLFEGNPVAWIIVGVIVVAIIVKAALNSSAVPEPAGVVPSVEASQGSCPKCSESLSGKGTFCRHCKEWLS